MDLTPEPDDSSDSSSSSNLFVGDDNSMVDFDFGGDDNLDPDLLDEGGNDAPDSHIFDEALTRGESTDHALLTQQQYDALAAATRRVEIAHLKQPEPRDFTQCRNQCRQLVRYEELFKRLAQPGIVNAFARPPFDLVGYYKEAAFESLTNSTSHFANENKTLAIFAKRQTESAAFRPFQRRCGIPDYLDSAGGNGPVLDDVLTMLPPIGNHDGWAPDNLLDLLAIMSDREPQMQQRGGYIVPPTTLSWFVNRDGPLSGDQSITTLRQRIQEARDASPHIQGLERAALYPANDAPDDVTRISFIVNMEHLHWVCVTLVVDRPNLIIDLAVVMKADSIWNSSDFRQRTSGTTGWA